MKVVVAGGHGKVGLRLTRLLAGRGDVVVGLVRNPAHVADVEDAGGEAVVVDLEQSTVETVAVALVGADAAVFSAGSGSGAPAERRDKVDRAAVALTVDAAERAGVRRFLHVSSINVGCADNDDIDSGYAMYLQAKRAAEQHLLARDGLDWTILRPGVLTDDAGTGAVELTAADVVGSEVVRFDPVPRDDVAAVLELLLDHPETTGGVYEVVAGETPIQQALGRLSYPGEALRGSGEGA